MKYIEFLGVTVKNTDMNIKITNNFKKEYLDEFVYNNPNTSIFQTTDMVEVYRRNKGCRPLIFVAINEDTGEILASMLVKILEEKTGFLSSFSRHSTIRGGPIFANDINGIIAVSKLLRYYNEIIKKNVIYSRIYPLNDTPQVIPCFKENGYEYSGWKNFLLDLNRPLDDIWRGLKKSRRYGINKAKRKGVIIEEVEDKEYLPIFYNLLKETYKKRNNPLEDISNFEATFDILVPKNRAKFFMAKYNEKYVSALLILLFKDNIYMWYLGSSQNKKDLSACPNDLLVWHAIEHGIQNGYRVFDFGGGGVPEDTSGWVEFKKQFGGKLVNYGRYTKIHQPKKWWIVKNAFKIYRKIFL